jgi:hypothetical protein
MYIYCHYGAFLHLFNVETSVMAKLYLSYENQKL